MCVAPVAFGPAMAGLVLTITAPPSLRRRFEAASSAEPLSGLAPAARDELAAILDRVERFEDLPGWWQAALLRAEAAKRGAPLAAGGGCCSGGG